MINLPHFISIIRHYSPPAVDCTRDWAYSMWLVFLDFISQPVSITLFCPQFVVLFCQVTKESLSVKCFITLQGFNFVPVSSGVKFRERHSKWCWQDSIQGYTQLCKQEVTDITCFKHVLCEIELHWQTLNNSTVLRKNKQSKTLQQ